MAITILWLALLGLGVLWELRCHRSDARWVSLSAIARRVWGRPGGRVVLIALWAFVGWHLFARYTLPR